MVRRERGARAPGFTAHRRRGWVPVFGVGVGDRTNAGKKRKATLVFGDKVDPHGVEGSRSRIRALELFDGAVEDTICGSAFSRLHEGSPPTIDGRCPAGRPTASRNAARRAPRASGGLHRRRREPALRAPRGRTLSSPQDLGRASDEGGPDARRRARAFARRPIWSRISESKRAATVPLGARRRTCTVHTPGPHPDSLRGGVPLPVRLARRRRLPGAATGNGDGSLVPSRRNE